VTIKWVINLADADPSRQASNIEDLITQGVNAIVARAEDAGAIDASIRAANAAGIPFVTFDRASGTVAPTAHVGGDSFDQALTAAVAFADLLKETGIEGRCIELQNALKDVNAVNRSKGWTEVDTARPEISTLVQVPTEWNPELFRSGMANALRAPPRQTAPSSPLISPSPPYSRRRKRWIAGPRRATPSTSGWPPRICCRGAVPLTEGGFIDVSTT